MISNMTSLSNFSNDIWIFLMQFYQYWLSWNTCQHQSINSLINFCHFHVWPKSLYIWQVSEIWKIQLTIGSFNLYCSDVSQIHNPSIMKLFSIFFSHWNFYPTEFTLKRYFLDTFRWLSGQKDQKSRLTDQKQQRESDVGQKRLLRYQTPTTRIWGEK